MGTECKQKRELPLIGILFLLLSILSVYWVWIQGPTYFSGDDLAFHLSRIEGIAESIVGGEFLPRINYFFAGGMGYPTGIFYPELFLYPAAIFRVLGFSIVSSYQLYLILLNFGTFLVSYYCFKSVHRTSMGAFLFSVLYGVSSYRMSDVLYRGAIGECVAFLLLPLVYVGIHQIIYGDKNKWWLLTVGMTGLLYSHPLSAFMVVLFLAVYVIVSLRAILTVRERLIRLFLATSVTVFLSLDILLPMLEQLLFQRLRVQDISLFYLSKEAHSLGEYLAIGFRNIGFNNIGLLIPIALLIGLIYIKWQTRENKRLLGIATLFFFLATSYFPHVLFNQTIFNTIQFPWRYFLIVSFLVSWVLAENVAKTTILSIKHKKIVGLVLIGITLGFNIQNQHQLKNVEWRTHPAETWNAIDRETSLGYGKEFLPNGMDGWMAPTSLLTQPQEGVILKDMSRNGNSFYLKYQTPTEARLIYPLLYYKGYAVEVNGEKKTAEDAGMFEGTDMHGFLQVTVKGSGSVLVWYEGTWIQKISRTVTIISWIVFIGYYVLRQTRKGVLVKKTLKIYE
ncbi:hypothetical protein CI088_01530 [Enterococcus plantarum]|uniref:Membrane protein 6-pyruvoyl-tetrahydropterin synthase-related domain-containing protein n=1 Tax=Enterococcus plantarum TaxID=1077675 RepID=A0A2W4BVQ2_9ENTE|nr:hypothetical protein CI088_01530 [Enterococcus plantarum]